MTSGSCRIGDCSTPGEYWRRLVSQSDFPLTQVQSIWFNLLVGKEKFDPQFFGVLPKDARIWCPSRKLLLMCAWEVVELAGVNPTSLSGRDYGYFLCEFVSIFEWLHWGS